MLKQNETKKWIQLRQKGQVVVESMREADIAQEIFRVWDKKLRRYIFFEEFSEHLISLGLAPDSNTVRKIMIALKGENASFTDQITLKEFSRLFELSRFGNKACEKLTEEFCEENIQFAR